MFHVTVLCVGRLKEKYLRDACEEYAKRLGAFCKLQITECAARPLPESPTQGEIAQALAAEGKEILSKIPANAKVYAMCIEGKQMPSEALAQTLEQCAVTGSSGAVFIIGGSHGLDDAVKRRADVRLSMSQMTFPHQLARVMLLEQLYRAFSIANGGKYHK